MKRNLIFQYLMSHIVKLQPGKTNYSLFGDYLGEHSGESITTIPEKDIIKWLMRKDVYGDFILSNIITSKKEADYVVFLEVGEPILTKEDQREIGDIDMLICPLLKPHECIVIELKRIKVNTNNEGEEKVNKVKDATVKGVNQVEELRKFNFHQTYLGIIIEDDGRNIVDVNTFFRFGTSPESKVIYDLTFDSGLDEYTGVFYLRINQPTSEDFTMRNNLGICMDKRAKPVIQSYGMTERVLTYLRQKGIDY